MDKKIIFQKCNFNNIYFLFYVIIDFIDILIAFQFYPKEKEIKEPESKYFLPVQILNFLYIHNLSDFLAIFPYFISKKLIKRKEEENINIKNEEKADNENINESPLIYNDNQKLAFKQKKKTIILYLILISILDFSHKFLLVLYSIIFPDTELNFYSFNCSVPFEIISQFICSYFILKIHFYKLQKLSLFLNLGIFIIILIIDIINILYYNSFDGKILYFNAIFIVFYSIEYSYVKKVLLNGFISIYLLMIIKGLILLILVLIFSLIIFLTKKDVFSRIGFFLTHTKYIVLIIVKIFSNFLLSLFIWLIIDRFSPNYFPFALIFNEVCYYIVEKIDGSKHYKIMGWDLYFRIFLYIISAIGVLIHNEIVVINICNLGSDTKYFLDLKVQSEEIYSKTDDPEVMKQYESFSENEPISEENGDSTKCEIYL